MTTYYGDSEKGDTDVWKMARNAVAIVLLCMTAYHMGLSRGRYDKRMSEYSALKAQYDRIEGEYSACKTECEKTRAEYSVLRDQYDKFQRERARVVTNQPKK